MESTARRPSFEEVLEAVQKIEPPDVSHPPTAEDIDIPIEEALRTKDGSNIPIRPHDLSPSGIGFLHYGSVDSGEVTSH